MATPSATGGTPSTTQTGPTVPVVIKPTVPKNGGVINTPDGKWDVWTGGKPKHDWTGLDNSSAEGQLGFVQDKPTPLYVDNQAAIAMINERRPTPRSRHIDIQHFAIQEWRAAREIEMHHIPGVINPSDQATKALGWTLLLRHVRRSMGHHRPF